MCTYKIGLDILPLQAHWAGARGQWLGREEMHARAEAEREGKHKYDFKRGRAMGKEVMWGQG